MQQNKTQKKFWSGSGGEMWVKDQAVFDRRLQSLGNAALQKIEFKTGMDESISVVDQVQQPWIFWR